MLLLRDYLLVTFTFRGTRKKIPFPSLTHHIQNNRLSAAAKTVCYFRFEVESFIFTVFRQFLCWKLHFLLRLYFLFCSQVSIEIVDISYGFFFTFFSSLLFCILVHFLFIDLLSSIHLQIHSTLVWLCIYCHFNSSSLGHKLSPRTAVTLVAVIVEVSPVLVLV